MAFRQVIKNEETGLFLKTNTAGDYYKEDKNRWVERIEDAKRFQLVKPNYFTAAQIAQWMTNQYGKKMSVITIVIKNNQFVEIV